MRVLLLHPVLALLLAACGPGDSGDDTTTVMTNVTTPPITTLGTDPGTDPTTAGTTGGDTGTGTTGPVDPTTGGTTPDAGSTTDGVSASTGDASTGTTDVKLDLMVPEPEPIPVKLIPGLMSITFYETTGDIKEYTFAVDSSALNNELQNPLAMDNHDIQGTSVEFYDVYYSDVDGVFDPDGSYLTIAGSFGAKLPAGGGLNLAEISLNYDDDSVEFGSFLASFVGLGDNYVPGSEPNAIDGVLATHTTMGNTVDTPNQRLRVTLGFKSSLMPG